MTKCTKRKREAQGRREEIVGPKFLRPEGDGIEDTSEIKGNCIDETSGHIKGVNIDETSDLNNCVAARLTKPGFIDAVKELAEMVPSDRLQTVLNDSVAARLTQPGFINAVKELAEMVPSDRLQTVLEQQRGGEVDSTGVHRCGKGAGGNGSVRPPPDGPKRLCRGEVDSTGVHRCGKGAGGNGSVRPPPDGPKRLCGGEVD